MASFGQEPDVDELIAPPTPAELSRGLELLELLLRHLLENELEALRAMAAASGALLTGRRRWGRSALFGLVSALFWEMLSKVPLCTKAEDSTARALVRCVTLLLQMADQLLQQAKVPPRAAVVSAAAESIAAAAPDAPGSSNTADDALASAEAAGPSTIGSSADSSSEPVALLPPDAQLRHSVLGLLPMLCSGLMLLGPDACSKAFAAKLLPSITPLLASLYEVAPSHDDPLADLTEEYHLGPLLKVIESGDHPYKPSYSADWTIESTQEVLPSELETSSSSGSCSRDGGSCGSWAHVSHAPCVWLAFDKRCSTVETEAWLDVLIDSKLAHTFSGPPSKWPSRPLVLPAGRITFRYKMVGCPASRKLPNRPRWGYRICVHAYEPSLSPTLPLLVDCQKALASLGAKYAAILLQGEPLSPEEHAHADELEKLPLPEPPGTAPPEPPATALSEPPATPPAVPPAAWLTEDDASSSSAPQADA